MEEKYWNFASNTIYLYTAESLPLYSLSPENEFVNKIFARLEMVSPGDTSSYCVYFILQAKNINFLMIFW